MATKESLSITESIGGRRYYNIDDNGVLHKLPSVTTILSAMTDQSGLEAWRNRVGHEEADRITTFSANRGPCMHQKLEYWFTSDIADKQARLIDVNRKMDEFVKENGYTAEELACGNKLFNSLYVCGFFERVKSIIEMEDTLYSMAYGGYAGRVDCVYENQDGLPVLLDFKTARHKKRPEYITNYYMQLSAYYLAYYQMFGVKLDHAELWIAVENDVPQLVYVTYEELKSWLNHFLKLVDGYHKKYDCVLEEHLKSLQVPIIQNLKDVVARKL